MGSSSVQLLKQLITVLLEESFKNYFELPFSGGNNDQTGN